jgi:DNA polymerase I
MTTLVDTPEALDDLIKVLNEAEMIAFDTETTDTDVMRATLVGISLAVEQDHGYYIPVGHKEGQQLPVETVLTALSGPLHESNNPKSRA